MSHRSRPSLCPRTRPTRNNAVFNSSALSREMLRALDNESARKAAIRLVIQCAIAAGFPVQRLPPQVVAMRHDAAPRESSEPYERLFGVWHGSLEVAMPEDGLARFQRGKG